MVSRSLGQVEAYLTVREILAETSKGVPPKAGLWREFSGFGRFRFATLGFRVTLLQRSKKPDKGYFLVRQFCYLYDNTLSYLLLRPEHFRALWLF